MVTGQSNSWERYGSSWRRLIYFCFTETDQAVLAIQMEATLDDLTKAPFPHPTLSESLAEAARDALDRPTYLP